MWGNIVTEVSLQSNFGVGFNNMKSDVLIHLTQWQYWWWFWFSFLWAFYYLVILRIVRFRTLKFRPRLATTFRPHGKWGDVLICIIPISWCANIISNSNFILRMIEWQAETGLLTIRIRGKQWYWIYKFELKTFTDVLTIPKNIGRNKWQISTPGDLQVADDYLHILQLRSQNKWVKKYWNDLSQKFSRDKNFHLISPQEQLQYNFYENFNKLLKLRYLNKSTLNVYKGIDLTWLLEESINDKYKFLKNSDWNNLLTRINNKKNSWSDLIDTVKSSNLNSNSDLESFLISNNFLDRKSQVDVKNFISNFFKIPINYSAGNKFSKIMYNYNDFLEVNRWVKRGQGTNSPLRLIKYPISNKTNFNFNSDIIELFRFRFNDNESAIKHKPVPHSTFLTMKQKRYKRRKLIPARVKFEKDVNGNNTKKIRWSANPYLFNNESVIQDFGNPSKQYNFMKKNKVRYENTLVVLSKRLLRTRRTLVLPAHVNITAVTNSYDVIHSWFIPGLGLKMDCIPGRATHHTFYIDNVGFYYGQCAEVCGRYHHHMPIRICALPFEHFLLWWHTFGLPKLLFTNSKKRYSFHYGARKFRW
jgi:heme/copper-type cytochrome/quinol oxidase subunit 2